MKRRLRELPLTLRVTLLSALGVLVVTLITTLIARELLVQQVSGLRDRELRLMAEHCAADAADADLTGDTPPAIGPAAFSEIYSGAYWRIRFENGDDTPALRSRSLWDLDLPELPEPENDEPLWGFSDGPLGQKLRTYSRKVEIAGREAILTVAADTAEFEAFQQEINRLFILALAAEGLLALLAAALTAWVSLESLRRFVAQIRAMRDGMIGEIDEDLPSEVAIAAQEVNALKTAQSRLIARARDQAGSLAHSLKTPLSVIIQQTERGTTVPSDTVREQAEAALQHVQHHLALARSAGAGARHAPVPLKPVVDGIARVLRPVMEQRGVAMELDVAPDFTIRMDEADLHDVLGNLMDNAVQHARARVRVASGERRDGSQVTIGDDGPGIDDDRIGDALSRGTSLEAAPGRTGLGLTLAHDIVDSYGGALTLRRSWLGGLEVTVDLPSADENG